MFSARPVPAYRTQMLGATEGVVRGIGRAPRALALTSRVRAQQAGVPQREGPRTVGTLRAELA